MLTPAEEQSSRTQTTLSLTVMKLCIDRLVTGWKVGLNRKGRNWGADRDDGDVSKQNMNKRAEENQPFSLFLTMGCIPLQRSSLCAAGMTFFTGQAESWSHPGLSDKGLMGYSHRLFKIKGYDIYMFCSVKYFPQICTAFIIFEE